MSRSGAKLVNENSVPGGLLRNSANRFCQSLSDNYICALTCS